MRVQLVALLMLLLCRPVAAEPPSRVDAIQQHMQRLEKLVASMGGSISFRIRQGNRHPPRRLNRSKRW